MKDLLIKDLSSRVNIVKTPEYLSVKYNDVTFSNISISFEIDLRSYDAQDIPT